jgi:hypothetical protein
MHKDLVSFFIKGWKKKKEFNVYTENAPSNSLSITVVSNKWEGISTEDREEVIREVFAAIYKNRVLNNIKAYTEEEYINRYY